MQKGHTVHHSMNGMPFCYISYSFLFFNHQLGCAIHTGIISKTCQNKLCIPASAEYIFHIIFLLCIWGSW